MKKKISKLFALTLVLLLVTFSWSANVFATTKVTLTTTATGGIVGQTLEVPIIVDQVGLTNFDLPIFYDPTKLRPKAIVASPIIQGLNPTINLNYAADEVYINGASLTATATSGVIATLQFDVIAAGATTLSLDMDYVSFAGTNISGVNAFSVTLNNTAASNNKVTLSTTATGSTVGQVLEVPISIDKVGLTNFDLPIVYDPTKLHPKAIVASPIIQGLNPTINLNYATNAVYINGASLTATTTSGVIATLQFDVIAPGATTLSLDMDYASFAGTDISGVNAFSVTLTNAAASNNKVTLSTTATGSTVGQVLEVPISIDKVGLTNFDLPIVYDPTKLHPKAIVASPIIQGLNPTINLNYATNAVYINGASLTATTTSGVIATLQFDVIAPGATTLSLDMDYASFAGTDISGVNAFSATLTNAAAAQSSAKDITAFSFEGLTPIVSGTVTGTNISATVPVGTSVTALVPTITVSPNASVLPASGEARNFTNPVTYTVTAQDSSTQTYTVAVTIAAAPTQGPSLQNASMDSTNKVVTLVFDKPVTMISNEASLKAAITFAADGSNFIALGASDSVAISTTDPKRLIVTFDAPLTGATNKLRIAAGSLKDASGNLSASTETTLALSGTIDECFIATAAFGSISQQPVVLLREFRDKVLLTNSLGQSFVNFYYQNSPPVARFIAGNELLKLMVRVLLSPVLIVAYLLINPIMGTSVVLLIGALAYMWRTQRKKFLHV